MAGRPVFFYHQRGLHMRGLQIVIIDGQGGRMGKGIVEQLKKRFPELPLTAVGTNSIATAAMIKAGADWGATGENPVIVNSRSADIIIGPVGIVIADSLLGEVTEAMAAAVGKSSAHKLLIPVSHRCSHTILGCGELPLSDYIRMACDEVEKRLEENSIS